MEREDAIARSRVLSRAERVFGVAALFVPRRLIVEEAGDAIEVITANLRAGRPVWYAYAKIGSTVFWLLVNVIHEVVGESRKARRGA